MLSRKYLLQLYYNYIMSHSFIRYIFLFELASTLYVAYALRDGFCFLSTTVALMKNVPLQKVGFNYNVY